MAAEGQTSKRTRADESTDPGGKNGTANTINQKDRGIAQRWIGQTPLSERLHPNQKNAKLDSQKGIEQFIDAEATAGARRTGRAWRTSELRLKSFDDLHRLWYILLKERNVLLTERAWCKTNGRYWTNGHSNMGKVRVSMARLKTVVGERLRAAKLRRAALAPHQPGEKDLDPDASAPWDGDTSSVDTISDQTKSQVHVAGHVVAPFDKHSMKKPLSNETSPSPQVHT